VGTNPVDILVFEVGGQRHGLAAGDVREILRAVAAVPLPQAPPGVEGVINLRGRVIPVVDLRLRFRLPPRPVLPTDHLIVARSGDRLVALRVDRAEDLVRLDRADLQPAGPDAGPVAKLADGLVPVHTLDELLPADGAAQSGALAQPGVSAEGRP
jgi:purine-binding chemotaxis protein CheW